MGKARSVYKWQAREGTGTEQPKGSQKKKILYRKVWVVVQAGKARRQARVRGGR